MQQSTRDTDATVTPRPHDGANLLPLHLREHPFEVLPVTKAIREVSPRTRHAHEVRRRGPDAPITGAVPVGGYAAAAAAAAAAKEARDAEIAAHRELVAIDSGIDDRSSSGAESSRSSTSSSFSANRYAVTQSDAAALAFALSHQRSAAPNCADSLLGCLGLTSLEATYSKRYSCAVLGSKLSLRINTIVVHGQRTCFDILGPYNNARRRWTLLRLTLRACAAFRSRARRARLTLGPYACRPKIEVNNKDSGGRTVAGTVWRAWTLVIYLCALGFCIGMPVDAVREAPVTAVGPSHLLQALAVVDCVMLVDLVLLGFRAAQRAMLRWHNGIGDAVGARSPLGLAPTAFGATNGCVRRATLVRALALCVAAVPLNLPNLAATVVPAGAAVELTSLTDSAVPGQANLLVNLFVRVPLVATLHLPRAMRVLSSGTRLEAHVTARLVLLDVPQFVLWLAWLSTGLLLLRSVTDHGAYAEAGSWDALLVNGLQSWSVFGTGRLPERDFWPRWAAVVLEVLSCREVYSFQQLEMEEDYWGATTVPRLAVALAFVCVACRLAVRVLAVAESAAAQARWRAIILDFCSRYSLSTATLSTHRLHQLLALQRAAAVRKGGSGGDGLYWNIERDVWQWARKAFPNGIQTTSSSDAVDKAMEIHMPASLWRRVERHYGATCILAKLSFLRAWSSRSHHMTGLSRLASWELRWKISKCLFRREFVHGEFVIEAGVTCVTCLHYLSRGQLAAPMREATWRRQQRRKLHSHDRGVSYLSGNGGRWAQGASTAEIADAMTLLESNAPPVSSSSEGDKPSSEYRGKKARRENYQAYQKRKQKERRRCKAKQEQRQRARRQAVRQQVRAAADHVAHRRSDALDHEEQITNRTVLPGRWFAWDALNFAAGAGPAQVAERSLLVASGGRSVEVWYLPAVALYHLLFTEYPKVMEALRKSAAAWRSVDTPEKWYEALQPQPVRRGSSSGSSALSSSDTPPEGAKSGSSSEEDRNFFAFKKDYRRLYYRELKRKAPQAAEGPLHRLNNTNRAALSTVVGLEEEEDDDEAENAQEGNNQQQDTGGKRIRSPTGLHTMVRNELAKQKAKRANTAGHDDRVREWPRSEAIVRVRLEGKTLAEHLHKRTGTRGEWVEQQQRFNVILDGKSKGRAAVQVRIRPENMHVISPSLQERPTHTPMDLPDVYFVKKQGVPQPVQIHRSPFAGAPGTPEPPEGAQLLKEMAVFAGQEEQSAFVDSDMGPRNPASDTYTCNNPPPSRGLLGTYLGTPGNAAVVYTTNTPKTSNGREHSMPGPRTAAESKQQQEDEENNESGYKYESISYRQRDESGVGEGAEEDGDQETGGEESNAASAIPVTVAELEQKGLKSDPLNLMGGRRRGGGGGGGGGGAKKKTKNSKTICSSNKQHVPPLVPKGSGGRDAEARRGPLSNNNTAEEADSAGKSKLHQEAEGEEIDKKDSTPPSSSPSAGQLSTVVGPPPEMRTLLRALYAFPGMEKGDLPLTKGGLVWGLERRGDWWHGQTYVASGAPTGVTGIFPSNYVEAVEKTGASINRASVR